MQENSKGSGITGPDLVVFKSQNGIVSQISANERDSLTFLVMCSVVVCFGLRWCTVGNVMSGRVHSRKVGK